MKALPNSTVAELESRGEATLLTGPFGTQLKASEYVSEGVPVINVRNIGFGDVRKADLEFLGEAAAERLHQHHLRKGDIVFGRKGAVERHALIDQNTSGWIQGSDCLRLRINSDSVSEKYLSYYLKTKAHQDWMQALCSFGATMSSLNQDIVRRISFPAPPRGVQDMIAAILTSYDDLIENNRRRIALLEKMADEIYREWFVRMRFPGYKQAKFEKGIPVGWRQPELGSIAEVNAHSISMGKEPEWIEYLDISAVSTNELGTPERMKFVDAPGRARRLVKHGDVIWSSVRPGNRAYCLVLNPPESLVASTGFAVISPRQGIPYSYVHRVVTTEGFVEQMVAVAKGAAYPATSFDDFERAKVLLPAQALLAAFHEVCEPMVLQSDTLRKQISLLAFARDALLPRLISGKLSVEHLDIHFPPSMQEALA